MPCLCSPVYSHHGSQGEPATMLSQHVLKTLQGLQLTQGEGQSPYNIQHSPTWPAPVNSPTSLPSHSLYFSHTRLFGVLYKHRHDPTTVPLHLLLPLLRQLFSSYSSDLSWHLLQVFSQMSPSQRGLSWLLTLYHLPVHPQTGAPVLIILTALIDRYLTYCVCYLFCLRLSPPLECKLSEYKDFGFVYYSILSNQNSARCLVGTRQIPVAPLLVCFPSFFASLLLSWDCTRAPIPPALMHKHIRFDSGSVFWKTQATIVTCYKSHSR